MCIKLDERSTFVHKIKKELIVNQQRGLEMLKFYSFLALIMLIGTLNIITAVYFSTDHVDIENSGKIAAILPLHVEGRYIKNSLNQTVYLRGINRPSGFTASCTGNWFEDGDWVWGQAYTQWTEKGLRQRLQQIKDCSFNVVRLIFFIEWWVNNSTTNLDGQTTNIGFRQAMRRTLEVAGEYGIYCVICPYASDQGKQQPMPFPSETIPDAQAFVNFWIEVAEEYKDLPNVIFELYNEPAGDLDVWLNVANMTIRAIRQITDKIIVIQYGYCGGFDWVPTAHALFGDVENIVYSNHIYRYPPGATLPSDIYEYEDIKNYLINHWNYSIVFQYPCWIGEIGAWLPYGEEETRYWNNTLRLLNEWGLGYAAWCWDQLGVGWTLQIPGNSAPYLPNENGLILIDAIKSASK